MKIPPDRAPELDANKRRDVLPLLPASHRGRLDPRALQSVWTLLPEKPISLTHSPVPDE